MACLLDSWVLGDPLVVASGARLGVANHPRPLARTTPTVAPYGETGSGEAFDATHV